MSTNPDLDPETSKEPSNKWLKLLFIPLFLMVIQNYLDARRDTKQFDSNLILQSIDRNDIESSRKNILFLIESGLISKENERIIGILSDTTFVLQPRKLDTVYSTPKNKYQLGEKAYIIRSQQVVDQFGIPVSGAEIYVDARFDESLQQWTNWFSKAITDDHGFYEIALPESSPYKFLITKQGYEIYHVITPNMRSLIFPKTLKLNRKRGARTN